MSSEAEAILILVGFLSLLVAGLHIALAIAIPATAYLVIDGGFSALNSLGFLSWGSMNSETLTAVPLFILMAELLLASGLSNRVYAGMDILIGRLPGGLLQTNIAGCAIFSSVSGSSIATAATIGRIALPQLEKRNYDPALSAGSLAAGGTLGILIPPSIALIIYSTFTNTSVPKLFLASLVPGLLLVALYMGYIALRSWMHPNEEVAPQSDRPTRQDYVRAIADVAPFVLLIGGTLGSLYAGIATTTEAATIGCVIALVMGLARRALGLRKLLAALENAAWLSVNILFIVLAAFIFSSATSFSGINTMVSSYIISLDLSRDQFFIAVFLLFTVMGMLVESIGMLVITVPLLYPILAPLGIDPLMFGVIVVLFLELAQITPPMGINLFVIQGMWNGKFSDVVRGVIPFALIIFLLAGLIVIWPDIALWLPAKFSG